MPEEGTVAVWHRVRAQIIGNHNLSEHYDIDLTEPGARTLLQKEYDRGYACFICLYFYPLR